MAACSFVSLSAQQFAPRHHGLWSQRRVDGEYLRVWPCRTASAQRSATCTPLQVALLIVSRSGCLPHGCVGFLFFFWGDGRGSHVHRDMASIRGCTCRDIWTNTYHVNHNHHNHHHKSHCTRRFGFPCAGLVQASSCTRVL